MSDHESMESLEKCMTAIGLSLDVYKSRPVPARIENVVGGRSDTENIKMTNIIEQFKRAIAEAVEHPTTDFYLMMRSTGDSSKVAPAA
jgi:hypothetical protein